MEGKQDSERRVRYVKYMSSKPRYDAGRISYSSQFTGKKSPLLNSFDVEYLMFNIGERVSGLWIWRRGWWV